MKLTYQQKQIPRFHTLIKQDRKRRKLSQKAYGELFGVTDVAVSLWETGQRQAPYAVTWMLYKDLLRRFEGKKREQ